MTTISNAPNIAVLLLSAGTGNRFGSDIPKQYLHAKGLPMIVHTLQALAAESRITFVQPVIAAGDTFYATIADGLELPFTLCAPVIGGASRAESMRNGLQALPDSIDMVAVHDAARPMPSPKLLADVLDTAIAHGSGVPGLDVVDTIKRIDANGKVLETLERSSLKAVQTPQVARKSWYEQAIAHAGASLPKFTDDVSLLEAAGFDVYVSPGDALNRKITTPEDLQWMENILATRI